MTTIAATRQLLDLEWVPFAGGELEGRRPKVMCPACRTRLREQSRGQSAAEAGSASGSAPRLCFECHRVDLARERALLAAGRLDTASDARFQFLLPLAAVDRARLARLDVERRQARVEQARVSPYVDRRRQAQLKARHALQRLAEGLRARGVLQADAGVPAAMSRRTSRGSHARLPFAASL